MSSFSNFIISMIVRIDLHGCNLNLLWRVQSHVVKEQTMKGLTVLTTVRAAERNVSRLRSTIYNVLWLIDCDSSVSLFSTFSDVILRSAESNLLKRRITSDNGCNVVMIVIRIDRNRHIIFRRVTSITRSISHPRLLPSIGVF